MFTSLFAAMISARSKPGRVEVDLLHRKIATPHIGSRTVCVYCPSLMQEAQQQTLLPLQPVHVPMSDSQVASTTPTAPITVRGVACFVVQLAFYMSMSSVTAFACLLWCVPGSVLLGVYASVEATIDRTVGKRARTRLQQNPAVAHTTADTDYYVTAFGQVSCASQIYGLGAPAA